MPVYEATQHIDVAAPAQAVFDVLTDYDHMPEWQSRVCECRVLSTDEDGRAREVEYVIDVKLRKVRYRLAQSYDEPRAIGSAYLGGDFKEFAGDYQFDQNGAGTRVTFHLRIDPGLRVPGRVAKMLNEAVMGRALKDLKRRVEELQDGA
jgi:ribosome-associated toxin RatA of RatAB toxin-antitoxin module